MFLTSLDQLLHFKMAWEGHVQQVSLFRHAHHEFSSKAKQKKSLERSTYKTKQNKREKREKKVTHPIFPNNFFICNLIISFSKSL